nr:immunoglobulin light chain junction region [Macaca mulatta]
CSAWDSSPSIHLF